MTVLDKVKPSDIDTTNHLWDTFGKFEREIVARNIIVIMKARENCWFSFSKEDYTKWCQHNVGWHEYCELESLVESKHLTKENDKYSVTPAFIAAVSEYVK